MRDAAAHSLSSLTSSSFFFSVQALRASIPQCVLFSSCLPVDSSDPEDQDFHWVEETPTWHQRSSIVPPWRCWHCPRGQRVSDPLGGHWPGMGGSLKMSSAGGPEWKAIQSTVMWTCLGSRSSERDQGHYSFLPLPAAQQLEAGAAECRPGCPVHS